MRTRSLTLLATPLTVAALALTGCGGDEGTTASDPSTDDSASSTGVSCEYPAGGQAAKEVEPPPSEATVSGEVAVTMSTSVGDLSATLNADATPCTVNSFVSLAEQGYFDGTSCHRLTTAGIFVLQCGDPSASGMGGPGYSYPDELTGDETYEAGTLAMANAGPDTNGSQFFIVYGDTQLPPSYTVFGTVDADAVKTVQKVAEKGTDSGGGDGAPKEAVDIEKVTVS